MKWLLSLGAFLVIGAAMVLSAWVMVFGWSFPGCHGVCAW